MIINYIYVIYFSIPLEVVNQEHDEQNALSGVRLDPDFAEEKRGNNERRTFLEEPSEFSIELTNCKQLMENLRKPDNLSVLKKCIMAPSNASLSFKLLC